MKFVATPLSFWLLIRFIGLVAGGVRVAKLDKADPFRRVARRACFIRLLLNFALAVVVIYAWAFALALQPVEFFVSLVSALLILSLAGALVIRLMQPEALDERLMTLFRLRR